MHAEGVRAGGKYQWSVFFEAEPELIKKFEEAGKRAAAGWESLEPEFT